MGTLLNDLHHATRSLSRMPGFTIVAVLLLAGGIGANTAIFSVIDAVLLRSLPYDEPDRLVMLWQQAPGFDYSRFWFAEPEYFDYRNGNDTMEEVALTPAQEAESAPVFVAMPMIRSFIGRARSRARAASM